MYILYGLVVTALGFLIVYKSEWFLNNFGRISFFENHLGGGGTRLGYKLIGIGVMIIGMMIMTGMISGFLGWILSPLIKTMKY